MEKEFRKNIEKMVKLEKSNGLSNEEILQRYSDRGEEVIAYINKILAQKPVDSNVVALEQAVNRCSILNLTPATDKQISFILSLLKKNSSSASDYGFGIGNTQAMLSSKNASELINILLNK